MVSDPKTLAAFVLEEFSERASRDVDTSENGSYSLQAGGPTSPPSQRGIAPQRRYQGAEAPWAKLTPAEVLDARTSPESTRAAGKRLGVDPKTISNLRRGVHYVTETVRPRCPSCGAEQNWPNMPKVTGCLPHCPSYGRRDARQPPPFVAEPPPKAQRTTEMVRARLPLLDRLERACDAWAQHRDQAVRGVSSPLSLLQLESEIELTVRDLRKLRGPT